IPLQQLNGLETLVIIMVANKYAFLQITRRRFLNEWEAFKKVISRRNIRRRITIPLTLSNLKLLRRRSEERRVGKERRSGWSLQHEQKRAAHGHTIEDVEGWLDGFIPYAVLRGDVADAVV